MGRRPQRTPSESARRLLERRRRRARKGGGRDGGNGLVFRGVSMIVVCLLLLLLCVVFGLMLQVRVSKTQRCARRIILFFSAQPIFAAVLAQ